VSRDDQPALTLSPVSGNSNDDACSGLLTPVKDYCSGLLTPVLDYCEKGTKIVDGLLACKEVVMVFKGMMVLVPFVGRYFLSSPDESPAASGS
jgi:hypothetical protein